MFLIPFFSAFFLSFFFFFFFFKKKKKTSHFFSLVFFFVNFSLFYEHSKSQERSKNQRDEKVHFFKKMDVWENFTKLIITFHNL